MKKMRYGLWLLLPFYACFTSSEGFGIIPLYQRALTLYHPADWVAYRLWHDQGKSHLALQVPRRDWDLRLAGYTSFDAKQELFRTSAQGRNLSDDTTMVVTLPTTAPLFAMEIAVYAPGNSDSPFFYDMVWVNRLQDNEQSILPLAANGKPLPRKYVYPNERFSMGYRNDSIAFIKFNYFKEFPTPAPPPHSEGGSLFNPLGGQDRRLSFPVGSPISLKEEGVYFAQSDSTSNKGAFLLCVDSDFPKMTRLNDLILSMRYITKNTEYDKMLQAADKKKELDEYWLNRNADKERARQQLKLYFGRIMEANRFFTAQTEGWKTDRGLVYVIFGAPNSVYKYSNKEIWRYAPSGDRPAVEFLFNRTGEQYTLQRNGEYREIWGLQVERWRRGVAE